MTCPCLHFREFGPGKHNKERLWSCIDCGALITLNHTVFNWVAMSYGKWRRKK